ncbi:acetylornithine transaminase [Bacillus sp. ISL-35]|uniref:acetylornithine transaminase n=1 Tax=Bacillus sp. ISL-35 TaxID=2819122 RepID=UPI001BE7D23A|nr:acetylornithine transaminase [Bacillus sp. ISL-35]MBT2678187.1 acetylornithine transaminase [Bacillus sp. ISL-35]MBT2702526.1 acetylornithine transaminase [Chryseobacterium sp. ISL-80]
MSHLFPTYQRWEIEPEKASGSVIHGKDGREYLDFTSGIGVCNLGHRPEAVEHAIKEQLELFWHVSNLFPQSIQEEAARKLVKASGLDCVFFANSGAEANEAAIKLARKATGRKKIITFLQSFHGRTFAGMAATGQEKIKHGFGNMLETFVHLPFNDLEALKNEIDSDTAAVMIEIVQGEGGIHVVHEEFIKETGKLCTENGILLIVDEIQTGIGRTGKPFAFQHFGISPDIITVAKGLGNGLPIGAAVGKAELAEHFGPGSHGSTFGGNPISTAAACAVMDIIFENEFLKEVSAKGETLFQLLDHELGCLEVVKEIRGIGLMAGIELTVAAQPYLMQLRKSGLIVLPAGEKVIRLLPPLNVSAEELEKAVSLIKEILINQTVTA